MGQLKNGGVGQIGQSNQKEQESGKRPRRKRTVGLFSNIPTPLCIESWSLWQFSGPGRLSYGFSPASHVDHATT
jgi:hypothetical protein